MKTAINFQKIIEKTRAVFLCEYFIEGNNVYKNNIIMFECILCVLFYKIIVGNGMVGNHQNWVYSMEYSNFDWINFFVIFYLAREQLLLRNSIQFLILSIEAENVNIVLYIVKTHVVNELFY